MLPEQIEMNHRGHLTTGTKLNAMPTKNKLKGGFSFLSAFNTFKTVNLKLNAFFLMNLQMCVHLHVGFSC